MTVEVRLLGGFEILRDGRPVPPMALHSSRTLFGYLVVHRDRMHTRDRLIGVFWPDRSEDYGRHQLRQALYQLRKPFEDDASIGLVIQGDAVGFTRVPGVVVDLDEFEWGLDRAAQADSPARERALLETAVSRYRGDLLTGFYDDWIGPEQDRLARRLTTALQRITDLALAAGDYRAALEAAYRRVDHDPAEEDAHRRVMEILALLGRHDEALRRYEQSRRILRENPGIEPSAATRRLREAILRDRDAGIAGGGGSPPPIFDAERSVPFVAREDEVLRMSRLLDGVPAGRGGVVLVEGEPGVGKSRFLDESARAARWRGIDVLRGGPDDSAMPVYGALAGAIATGASPLRLRQLGAQLDPLWRANLAPVLPSLDPGPGHAPALLHIDDRDRTREAFVQFLYGLASLSPVLLTIDDWHRVDRETLAVVARAALGIEDRPLLVILAYRHVEARDRPEVWQLLRELDGYGWTTRFDLAPLSPARTEELIRAALATTSADPDMSDRIHRQTGGVPLLIIEALRSLSEHGEAETEQQEVRAVARDHLRARLEGTDPAVVDLLRTLAVCGAGLLADEIAMIHDDLIPLDTADRRRLVVETGGCYRIAHDLLRQTVLEELSTSQRLDLHRRIALAIEAHRPQEILTLAHHFEAAKIPDRAALYLEAAAVQAMTAHALDDAADLLERTLEALDAAEAPEAHRYQVARALEPLLDTLGERDRQGAVLDRMAELGRGDDPEVLLRRAGWLLIQDRMPEAEEAGRRAVEAARDAADEKLELAALTRLAKIASVSGRAEEGVQWVERAVRRARRRDGDVADAHRALGQNLIDLQRFDDAERHLHAALAIYGESGNRRGQADTLGALGTLRLEQGDTENAESELRRAVEGCAAIGYRRGEATFRTNLGILYLVAQRISEALGEFDQALLLSRGAGSLRGQALAMANAAWLHLAWLGNHAEAWQLAEEARYIYQRLGDLRGETQCMTILGAAQARQGNRSEGEHLIRQALSLTDAVGDRWLRTQVLRELSLMLIMGNRAQEALVACREGLEACEHAGLRDIWIDLKALEAWALIATGRAEEALASSSDAMQQLTPGVELRHLVPYVHALTLRATGDTPSADRFLHEANRQLNLALQDLPPDARNHALISVPISAMIGREALERMPKQISAVIPAAWAPLGRPLRADERIQVRFTVWMPEDEQVEVGQVRRRHILLRLLAEAANQDGTPTIPDLASALGVSVATVRRDVAALREAGFIIHTRGRAPG